MEPVEYERMAALEDRMWWYVGLHRNLLAVFDRFAPKARAVLDDGSGTGGFLARLGAHRPGLSLAGIDIEPVAAAHAARKSGAVVLVGSVNALPYDDARFDAVFSNDILCHGAVDPHAALSEAWRVLRPGGHLFLQLPAYQWMLSYHDHAVHNVRRFTRSEAVSLAETAGFDIAYAGYWNMLLFPLMAAQRLLVGRARPQPDTASGENDSAHQSDVTDYPPLLTAIFSAALGLERMLIRRGMTLPFGGSILVVARRPA